MTNVPNELRELWADIYKLFDVNYKMPNTPEAWATFHKQAFSLYLKYSKNDCIPKLTGIVAEMLDKRMKQEQLETERQELETRSHPHTLEDMDLF